MFTILIASLKQNFLKSQMAWLSKQTYKDFGVVVMDSHYKANQHQPWLKKLPFPLVHVPLVHNVRMAKRFDFSIKNNLALLSPTQHFVFLSDTHYVRPSFAEKIAESILTGDKPLCFRVNTVLYNAFDPFRSTLDIGGETNAESAPVLVFDRRTFFYVLNGFDEAGTYSSDCEFMLQRIDNASIKYSVCAGVVYHILHTNDVNDFGDRWIRPCDKCKNLFGDWKFQQAHATGSFPMGRDAEAIEQFTFRDGELGLEMFECPNCGFSGILNPYEYMQAIENNKWMAAPVGLLDGRCGRDLGKLYEVMTRKVKNDVVAKLAYLRTTY